MKIKTRAIKFSIFVLFLLTTVESRKWKRNQPFQSFHHKYHTRIRNGTIAKLAQFPFYAALKINQRVFCGGSIITNMHILTASHCLVKKYGIKKKITHLQVIVGSIHWDGKDGEIYSVNNTFVHPDYIHGIQKYYGRYDIGIVKLTKPIRYSGNIQPIGLSEYLITNAPLHVVGLGLQNNKNIPFSLQFAKLPSIVSAQCSYYRDIEGFICIKSSSTGHCSGDSGGPLIFINRKKYVQVGIVTGSHGVSCMIKSHFHYQDVSYHRPWIMHVTHLP